MAMQMRAAVERDSAAAERVVRALDEVVTDMEEAESLGFRESAFAATRLLTLLGTLGDSDVELPRIWERLSANENIALTRGALRYPIYATLVDRGDYGDALEVVDEHVDYVENAFKRSRFSNAIEAVLDPDDGADSLEAWEHAKLLREAMRPYRCLLHVDRLDEAAEVAAALLAEDDRPEAHAALVEVAHEMGEPDFAAERLAHALDVLPKSAHGELDEVRKLLGDAR